MILGFFRAASALLARSSARIPTCSSRSPSSTSIPSCSGLWRARPARIYGDVSNVDTLVHAGIGKAEIILSVPDSLLKGVNNERLVRHLRIDQPDRHHRRPRGQLANVNHLYAAGADYVTVTRLSDAHEVLHRDRGRRRPACCKTSARKWIRCSAERKEVLPWKRLPACRPGKLTSCTHPVEPDFMRPTPYIIALALSPGDEDKNPISMRSSPSLAGKARALSSVSSPSTLPGCLLVGTRPRSCFS